MHGREGTYYVAQGETDKRNGLSYRGIRGGSNPPQVSKYDFQEIRSTHISLTIRTHCV